MTSSLNSASFSPVSPRMRASANRRSATIFAEHRQRQHAWLCPHPELTLCATLATWAQAPASKSPGIKRAADRFLATASYIAEGAARVGRGTCALICLSRAQANFGDPASTQTTMFAMLDDFWSSDDRNWRGSGVSTLRRDEAMR